MDGGGWVRMDEVVGYGMEPMGKGVSIEVVDGEWKRGMYEGRRIGGIGLCMEGCPAFERMEEVVCGVAQRVEFVCGSWVWRRVGGQGVDGAGGVLLERFGCGWSWWGVHGCRLMWT